MDALKTGWFSEISDMWPGVCLSFEVDDVLHAEKSDYQDIMIIQTYVQKYNYYYNGQVKNISHK